MPAASPDALPQAEADGIVEPKACCLSSHAAGVRGAIFFGTARVGKGRSLAVPVLVESGTMVPVSKTAEIF